MAKNSQTININFDASMDIKQVASAVQNIGKEFDILKSKMPQGLSKRFTSDLQKLEEELNNFSSASSNMKNLGDIGKADKSLEKIVTLYKKLQQEASDIGNLDVSSFLPDDIVKKIENANQAVKNYEKQIESLGKEADDSKKKINELIDLKKQHKKLVSDRTKTKTAKTSLQPDKIEAIATRDAAKAALDKAKLKSSGIDEKSQEYKDLIATAQQTQNALDEVNAKIKEQDNILKSTTAGLQKNENAQKGYAEITQQFGTSITQLKASLTGLGDAAKLTAFENLKIELEKIAGIDVSGLKQDLSNIDDITSGISAEASKKVAEAIQKIQKNASGAEPAIDGMQDKLHQTGESAKELTRAAQEVERLKQQVLDFFSIGNAIQLFKRAVSSAFATVKELDKTMTETAVVTKFSVGDMWSQLPQYTQRANELGVSIKGAYEAATLYYQQGLRTNEVVDVSNETLKMARIAGMEVVDATNLMTAALRGFNMEVNEMSAQKVNDVYSELAAITAADTQEIGIAMSKTASIAKSANMEFETTAALLSQIIETTREAPETAGTAMKTIIARFTEVKKLISEGQLTGSDEEGEVIDVNKIDTALKTVGISLKGFMQGTEGIDDIFLKLAEKWGTLDIATQRYIATQAAGSRQQSRFLAMMGDYERTMELVGAANNSAGASQKQFEKTLDSMESKLAKLKNAWDEFVMGLANNEAIKFFVGSLTGILNVTNSLLKTFSGGQSLVKTFLTALLAIGAFKLGKSILGVGKNGGFLSGLFGSNIAKDATTQGNKFGANFVKGVNEKIQKAKKTNFKAVMADMFSGKDLSDNIFSSLEDTQRQGIQKALKDNLAGLSLSDADKIDIGKSIDAGKIDEATAKTAKCGETLKLTSSQAQEFGVTINKSFQMAGAGAQVLGGAFLGLATLLNSLGASDEVVTSFTTLGTVLMGAGAIVSTVSGIFTAAGVEIGTAGFFAQAGWWWLIVIIAALAAVTVGLVLMSKAAKKASLAGRMEEAQKATEAAKESADSAKQSYDALLSSQEEYTGLQDTLENLTKGTNEWKQALIKVNGQVLQLLSTYPQLAQYISRGESGQLTISDKGWRAVIEEQQGAMQRAQAAVVSSQMAETRIQGQMNERQLVKKFQIITDTQLAAAAGSYGAYGYPGLEDAGYLARTGTDEGIYYDQELMDQLRGLMESGDLSDAVFAPLVEANKQYGETNEQTIARLRELTGALNEYDAALLANQAQLESQAEALLTAGANQEILNSDYNKTVVSGFAKRMTTGDYAKKEEGLGKEVGAKDGTKREELLKARGITVTGDQKKDTQALYASLAGLKSIEDIPADLKDNTEAMAAQIGKMLQGEEQVKAMEGFQKKLNAITDKDIAKNIAGLMSGDASQFTKEDLGKVGNLSDYAEKLGYASAEEMAGGLGYTQKTVSALDKEDQLAYAKQMVGEQGDLSDTDYQKAIDDWIAANGAVEISAEVQMNIDSNQYKQQMQDAYDKASAGLQAKGIKEDSYKNLAMETVSNLSKQTENMSNEAAKKYVENFNKVLSSSNLGESGTQQLENYLSVVDWSNMTDAIQAMDYMQSMGVDSDIIQEYWNTATDGANTYVSTLSEILSLTDRMQQKLSSVTDISSRLEEGTASYEDMQKLVEAGADIGDFQLTPEGWKATAEQIGAATDKMKEYNAEQARKMADQQRQEFSEAKELTKTGVGVADEELTTFEDGVYKGGDLSTVDKSIREDVATQLGIQQGENETEKEFLTRLQAAYDSYISLLNNGEDIQIIADKQAAMAEAAKYTASENEARGDTAESIIYSAQNEATEAGLDANEMMQYADTLRQVHTELDEVTAAQVALANSKMNAGLGEIIDSYDEWSTILDKDTGALKDTSAEGVATYNKLKASANKMLNTSEDLSDAFWDNAENMKNIEKAAKGDTKALGELQKAAAKDFLINLDAENLSNTAENAINDFLDYYNNIEIPPIEPGVNMSEVWSGAEEFRSAFNQMAQDANLSAEQIQKAAQNMGFDANITYVEQTRKLPMYSQTETKTENGDGTTTVTSGTPVITGYENVTGYFPVVETFTPTGTGGGGVSVNNKKAGSAKSGGGGGGGGGSKKPEKQHWENPYDELRNLTEKVNTALRNRNSLEREYDIILQDRSTSAQELLNNSLKQLANLRKEISLQKQLLQGRQKQLKNAPKAGYLGTKKSGDDEEQFWTTYAQEAQRLGLGDISQYASINKKTGKITIDWSKIEAIEDNTKNGEDQGALIEAYISYLEEIQGNLQDTRDTIEDMEDQVKEIQERGKAEYVDFEQRIYDALVARDQKVIDNYQELSDTISKSNTDVLDSLQESIDLERQIRDNTKIEEDIAEKEARLAYLRRDTSGANALEIKQLEEEIKDAQEAYGDTLVDQEIQRLTKINEDATEQRERQIEIMQSQLDYAAKSGQYWAEVSGLLSNAFKAGGSLNNNSALVSLLKETEGFKALSEFGGMQWIDQLIESWLSAQEGLGKWKVDKAKQDKNGVQTTNAGKLVYNSKKGVWENGKGGTYSDVVYDPQTGKFTASGYTPKASKPSQPSQPENSTQPSTGKLASVPAKLYSSLTKSEIKSLQEGLNNLLADKKLSGFKKLDVDGIYGPATTAAVKKLQSKIGTTADGKWGENTAGAFKKSSLKAYKAGGMIDFTGPAWLDGSKSKPESMLDAIDTKNFIQLKEILAEILKGASISGGSGSGGDNYFDVNIAVDSLSNDYDVEKLATKVKDIINSDARYRNVNSINFLR